MTTTTTLGALPDDALPKASVVVPARNEADAIRACLGSILASDYPADRLEVLVVDGRSDDGTREAVEEAARRDSRVRLVDNPRRIIPAAMNAGIRAATGEVVLKMDAHSDFPPSYVRACVEGLLTTGAEMVGGVLETMPRDDTVSSRAVALALGSRWGSRSGFRVGTDKPVEADAAAFGCWRRSLFDRVGLFNEKLVRSSDIELNARIRRAGGRILLLPGIRARYYPQATLRTFWRKNRDDGYWAVYPYRFVSRAVSLKHLAPLAALLLGLVLLALAPFLAPARWLLAAGAAAYLAVSLGVSAWIALRERDARFLLAMPYAFACRHWGYAIGSLDATVRLLGTREFWTRRLRAGRASRA